MLVKELSKRLNISEEGARLAVSLISTVSSWDEVREAVSSATSASGSSSDSSNLIQQLTWVLLLKQLNRDPAPREFDGVTDPLSNHQIREG